LRTGRTTLNGQTVLDKVDIRIDDPNNGLRQCISLQAVLELPNASANDIIDVRAFTYDGSGSQASLFAMLIDDIMPAPSV
jgi:hypothetical protein